MKIANPDNDVIVSWLADGAYRTIVHRHDDTFIAADEAEGRMFRADHLHQLAFVLHNWPSLTSPIPKSNWKKVAA